MLLAGLVHLLVLLLLLRLAPEIVEPQEKKGAGAFELLPDRGASQTKAVAQKEDSRPSGGGGAPVPRALEPEMPTPEPAETRPPAPMVDYLRLTDSEMLSLDRTLATRSSPRNGTSGGAAAGPAELAANGGGDGGDTGPNGERLYPADWQRRPTRAELGFYLPPGLSGWGMIACRTAPNFRVEDCRELGQSPAGSGLSRAVREAAWQFRIHPPRVGGKPMIGAWVSIRIDYVKGEIR